MKFPVSPLLAGLAISGIASAASNPLDSATDVQSRSSKILPSRNVAGRRMSHPRNWSTKRQVPSFAGLGGGILNSTPLGGVLGTVDGVVASTPNNGVGASSSGIFSPLSGVIPLGGVIESTPFGDIFRPESQSNTPGGQLGTATGLTGIIQGSPLGGVAHGVLGQSPPFWTPMGQVDNPANPANVYGTASGVVQGTPAASALRNTVQNSPVDGVVGGIVQGSLVGNVIPSQLNSPVGGFVPYSPFGATFGGIAGNVPGPLAPIPHAAGQAAGNFYPYPGYGYNPIQFDSGDDKKPSLPIGAPAQVSAMTSHIPHPPAVPAPTQSLPVTPPSLPATASALPVSPGAFPVSHPGLPVSPSSLPASQHSPPVAPPALPSMILNAGDEKVGVEKVQDVASTLPVPTPGPVAGPASIPKPPPAPVALPTPPAVVPQLGPQHARSSSSPSATELASSSASAVSSTVTSSATVTASRKLSSRFGAQRRTL